MNMASDFADIFTLSISLRDVVFNLLVALFCGIIISTLYRYTYKGLNYSASFAISMIMLTMITSIVIMVIGNNLARAFGMVGAMSIIRFRTAVKDATDIMFIFFSLTIGLAAGVKMYAVAIFGTIFISLIFLIISQLNFGLSKKREYLLQVIMDADDVSGDEASGVIRNFTRKYKLVNVKALGEEGHELMEYSFHIFLKNEDLGNQLVVNMKKHPSVKTVNLFFDEN
ncbi:MAG: DUF4956 domain-containing protein [Bacteroidia bacterium]|nr:MAG: DUF4956 domain-containing protein [Bacteroidia bacterium]